MNNTKQDFFCNGGLLSCHDANSVTEFIDKESKDKESISNILNTLLDSFSAKDLTSCIKIGIRGQISQKIEESEEFKRKISRAKLYINKTENEISEMEKEIAEIENKIKELKKEIEDTNKRIWEYESKKDEALCEGEKLSSVLRDLEKMNGKKM